MLCNIGSNGSFSVKSRPSSGNSKEVAGKIGSSKSSFSRSTVNRRPSSASLLPTSSPLKSVTASNYSLINKRPNNNNINENDDERVTLQREIERKRKEIDELKRVKDIAAKEVVKSKKINTLYK